MKTLKRLLDKCEDPYSGLLVYRSTPLENGFSPAELLMGRKLRTTLPILQSELCPRLSDHSKLKKTEEKIQERQKRNFDTRHKARSLSSLKPGDIVWLPEYETTVKVRDEVAPRSYIVDTTEGGRYRRNRRHIVPIPENKITEKETNRNGEEHHLSSNVVGQPNQDQDLVHENNEKDSVRTRCGRLSKTCQENNN